MVNPAAGKTFVYDGKNNLVAVYQQSGSNLVQLRGVAGAGFGAAQRDLANKGISITGYRQWNPEIERPMHESIALAHQNDSRSNISSPDLRQRAKMQNAGLSGLYVSTGKMINPSVSAVQIQSSAPPGTIQFKSQQLKREEMPLAAKNYELTTRSDELKKEFDAIDSNYKDLEAKSAAGTLTQSDVEAYTTRATNYNTTADLLRREIKSFEGKAEKFESKVKMFNLNEVEPYNKAAEFAGRYVAPTIGSSPQFETPESFAKKFPLKWSGAEFESPKSMKTKYPIAPVSVFDIAQKNEPQQFSFFPKFEELPTITAKEWDKFWNTTLYERPMGLPLGILSAPQNLVKDISFPFAYASTAIPKKGSSKAKRLSQGIMGTSMLGGTILDIGNAAIYRAKQQYQPEEISEREYLAKQKTELFSTAVDLAMWQLAFGGVASKIGKATKGELKFLSESDVELSLGKGKTAESIMGTMGKGKYSKYLDLGIYGNYKLPFTTKPVDFFQLEFGKVSELAKKSEEPIEAALAKLLPKEPGGIIEFTPKEIPTAVKKEIEFLPKVKVLEPTVSKKTVVGIVRVGGKKKVLTLYGGGGTSVNKIIKGTKTVFDLPEGKDYVFEMLKGGKKLRVSGGTKFAMGNQEEFDVSLNKLFGEKARGSIGKTKTTFLEAESAGLKGYRKTIGAPKTVVAKKGVPIDVFFEDVARYRVSSKAKDFDKFVSDAMMGSRMGKGAGRTPFYSQKQLLKLEAGGKLPTITIDELAKATQKAVKAIPKTKAKPITAVLMGGGGAGTIQVLKTKPAKTKGVYLGALLDFEESGRVAPGFGTSYAMGTSTEQRKEQGQRVKAFESLMPFQASKELSKMGVKNVSAKANKFKDITASLIGTFPISKEKERGKEMSFTEPGFVEAQAIGVRTAILPIELAATKQKIIQGFNFDFGLPEPPIPKPRIPLIPLFGGGRELPELGKGKRKGKFNPGFIAYVKRRGNWLPTTRQALPKISAMSSGAKTVDRFTQKSFTIRKAKKPAIGLQDNSWLGLQGKFRRKGNVFIERNAFAIDSPEERAGIPFAGIAAKKRYAKLRRLGYL